MHTQTGFSKIRPSIKDQTSILLSIFSILVINLMLYSPLSIICKSYLMYYAAWFNSLMLRCILSVQNKSISIILDTDWVLSLRFSLFNMVPTSYVCFIWWLILCIWIELDSSSRLFSVYFNVHYNILLTFITWAMTIMSLSDFQRVFRLNRGG